MFSKAIRINSCSPISENLRITCVNSATVFALRIPPNLSSLADGGGEVEETLGDLVRCPGEVVPDLEHHDLRIEEGLGGHIRHGDGDEVRHDAYIPHEGLCLIDEGSELCLWDARGGDDDILDAGITNDALHVTKSTKDGAGLVVGLMVFEEADDAVAHADIIRYLACHDFAGLSRPDDEDGGSGRLSISSSLSTE